jgi:hypothetical protein
MFTSDRGLKKGSIKRNNVKLSKSSTSFSSSLSLSHSHNEEKSLKETEQKETLLERTRKERLERQILRENSEKVLLIQKRWRGWFILRQTRQKMRQEFDQKLTDIERVSSLLLQTKSIQFISPIGINFNLLRLLLFQSFLQEVNWIFFFSFFFDEES